MPHKVEDAPLKLLYALAFVLSAFAAHAQTLDAAMMAACELDDCSLEVIEHSMPAPTVASEPTITTVRDADDEADDVSITGANDPEGVPVPAIQPGDESQTQQSTIAAQIASSEPTIATVRADDDEADDVVITGANGAEDALVGATEDGDETRTRPAQMVASEPTIEKLAEAVDEAEGSALERVPPPSLEP
jgi:hypothetical protein